MIGGAVNTSANCEGLPLGWDCDVRVLFDLGPYRALWVKTWRSQKAGLQARRVVGWTDDVGGSPCPVQLYVVYRDQRYGVLLCGGNNGLRILANEGEPDLHTAKDAHLPNGWGVPVLMVKDLKEIVERIKQRAMDDPAMRRRIREIYRTSMSSIISNYPHCDPYLVDWSEIFTPIESNVWSDIRDLGLPMYPQFPVGPYFLDFADPVKKLGIEVDGQRYHQNQERENAREQALKQQGWTIIRIEGRDTYKKPDEEMMEYAGMLPMEDDPMDSASYALLRSPTAPWTIATLRSVQLRYYADHRRQARYPHAWWQMGTPLRKRKDGGNDGGEQ
jgi:very-short-patch-repair endonuclease